MDPTNWHALVPDSCPAYISWTVYERNQERLRQNRAEAEARGAVRHGAALLAGLVVCWRCGRCLQVHYNRHNHQGFTSHTLLPQPDQPATKDTGECQM
jgi:hypothetical protein